MLIPVGGQNEHFSRMDKYVLRCDDYDDDGGGDVAALQVGRRIH
jgi:hypothetical protein